MGNFMWGLFTGLVLMGMITFMFPRHLTGVNNELVKAGLAGYDSKTGVCVWNDKIKESK